jgi:hypothetical protein
VAKVEKEEKEEKVTEVPKVEETHAEEEKLTHTVKVTETNNRKLTALAGELQAIRETKQTPNDAITHLFEIKEGKDKHESKTPKTTRL